MDQSALLNKEIQSEILVDIRQLASLLNSELPN